MWKKFLELINGYKTYAGIIFIAIFAVVKVLWPPVIDGLTAFVTAVLNAMTTGISDVTNGTGLIGPLVLAWGLIHRYQKRKEAKNPSPADSGTSDPQPYPKEKS